MDKIDWTKLHNQLDVPPEKGLPEILIRLAWLEAAVQTIADSIMILMVDKNSPYDEIVKAFNDKHKNLFIELKAELVSKYHRSDAPDENLLHQ